MRRVARSALDNAVGGRDADRSTLQLLSPQTAVAGSASLTCTAPTQNEDGSSLTDLTSYRLYWSLTSGGPYTQENGEYPVTTCSFTFERPEGGMYYFVATAVNSSGVESQNSGEASKDIPPDVVVPNPPGGLTVQEDDLSAWTFQWGVDNLVVYQIGTIPAGTPCDSTTKVNDMHRVDVSHVDFVNETTDADIAFASCGSGI